MIRAITGNLFKSDCDCIVVPVKTDLVLEGNIGGQADSLLGKQALFDIKLLKKINYGEATLIYTHGCLPSKAVILVANTWKSRNKNPKLANKKTDEYLKKSYRSCVKLAIEAGFNSIAFPALSTGRYEMTFRRSFECFFAAVDDMDADGVPFKEKLNIDFHLGKKDIYKNYKELIDDCCDIHIERDDFEPIDKTRIMQDRARLTPKWFEDNEYGVFDKKDPRFTEVFSSFITKSGKSKKDIFDA